MSDRASYPSDPWLLLVLPPPPMLLLQRVAFQVPSSFPGPAHSSHDILWKPWRRQAHGTAHGAFLSCHLTPTPPAPSLPPDLPPSGPCPHHHHLPWGLGAAYLAASPPHYPMCQSPADGRPSPPPSLGVHNRVVVGVYGGPKLWLLLIFLYFLLCC